MQRKGCAQIELSAQFVPYQWGNDWLAHSRLSSLL